MKIGLALVSFQTNLSGRSWLGRANLTGINLTMIDPKVLEILVCPKTKAPVVLDGERLVSTDPETRLSYSIDEGIPNMLIEEATELSPEEHQEVLKKHQAEPFKK